MGTGLRIQRPPGLAGAYIVGQQVHAYVVATGGQYHVDLWRRYDQDPYQTAIFNDLDSAVEAASAASVTR